MIGKCDEMDEANMLHLKDKCLEAAYSMREVADEARRSSADVYQYNYNGHQLEYTDMNLAD